MSRLNYMTRLMSREIIVFTVHTFLVCAVLAHLYINTAKHGTCTCISFLPYIQRNPFAFLFTEAITNVTRCFKTCARQK